MNEEEINNFILNYLKNDKTGTALLLDGSWGSGKTYYIKNSLIPFLKNNKKKAIYISMYGTKSVTALSKSIFTESYLQILNNSKAIVVTGVAKTILKGLASYFNVEIDGGKGEWKKLCKYVNLKDKLLIIDDLERHDPSLSIIEILGFINNLCENDNVKILLICDECSLIKLGLDNNDYDKYKLIKEKTIGETLSFTSDFPAVISSFLTSFDLRRILGNRYSVSEKIADVCLQNKNFSPNLRSMTKACQKMNEIAKAIETMNQKAFEDSSLQDFLFEIFMGLIFFYHYLSKDSSLVYSDSNQLFSVNLGTPQYPLYKFAYDFCIKHQPFSDEFKSAFDHYKAEKEILRANKDVQIIKSYSLAKDSELIESIEKLKESINNRYIPCSAYTGLASHLIAIKYNLHFEGIDQLLELMIERVKFEKESGEIEESLYSYSGCYLESQEMKDEFCNFLKKMKTTLIAKKEIHCARITNSEQLSIIIKKVKENMQTLLSNKDGFSTHINFNSMIDYIESSTCSPSDIFSIRMLFSQLYSNITNVSDYKSTDLPVLKTIKHRIDTLLKNNFDGKKTTELQLKGFATNLKELIKAFDC